MNSENLPLVVCAQLIEEQPDRASEALDCLELWQSEHLFTVAHGRFRLRGIDALITALDTHRPDLMGKAMEILLKGQTDNGRKDVLFRLLLHMEKNNRPHYSDVVINLAQQDPLLMERNYLVEAGITQYMLGWPWLMEALAEQTLLDRLAEISGKSPWTVWTEELLNNTKFEPDIQRGMALADILMSAGFSPAVDVPGWTGQHEIKVYPSPMDKVCARVADDDVRAENILEILAGCGIPAEHLEKGGRVGEVLNASRAYTRHKLTCMARSYIDPPRKAPKL